MALEPCYLIYYQTVLVFSEARAMSIKMNLCKLIVKRRRDWLPPSFLTASPFAPHNVLSISMTQMKNKRLLTVYYQILNFFSFFFQFSGQLRVFHCMFTATFPVCVLFCTDVSYVIGITYQTIDKSLISELLGGLQGMWFIEWCNMLLD